MLFPSFVFIWSVPLSASLKTYIDSCTSRKRLHQHQKRAGRTSDYQRKCSSPIKVCKPLSNHCPRLSQPTHQMQGHQSWRAAVEPKANHTSPGQQPGFTDSLHRCCHNQTLTVFLSQVFQTTASPESTGSQAEVTHSSSLLKSGQTEAICETSFNEGINLMKETRAKANYRSQQLSYASCLIVSFGQGR